MEDGAGPGRAIVARGRIRSFLSRIFFRKQVPRPKPTQESGRLAEVIPINAAKGGKGNEFKSGLGKEKGMVDEVVSEEDKLKARLKHLEGRIKEYKSADISHSKIMQDMLKSMESEADFIRHKFNGYTKEEIFGALDEIARDFKQLEKLLEFPAKKLYIVKEGYSEKKDDDSIGLYYEVRSNEKLPKASETVFSFGFVDSTSQTYFILCDPYRKIVVVEQLLYLGEGSWSDVASSLKMALDEKKGADQREEEYNFIVSNLGHVSVE